MNPTSDSSRKEYIVHFKGLEFEHLRVCYQKVEKI